MTVAEGGRKGGKKTSSLHGRKLCEKIAAEADKTVATERLQTNPTGKLT
jgi:hypothetical protein